MGSTPKLSLTNSIFSATRFARFRAVITTDLIGPVPPPRLLHVRNGNCKYHLGEETVKLAQSYMDKLATHGHHANKAALYGELCALLFAKSHYDEVRVSVSIETQETPEIKTRILFFIFLELR